MTTKHYILAAKYVAGELKAQEIRKAEDAKRLVEGFKEHVELLKEQKSYDEKTKEANSSIKVILSGRLVLIIFLIVSLLGSLGNSILQNRKNDKLLATRDSLLVIANKNLADNENKNKLNEKRHSIKIQAFIDREKQYLTRIKLIENKKAMLEKSTRKQQSEIERNRIEKEVATLKASRFIADNFGRFHQKHFDKLKQKPSFRSESKGGVAFTYPTNFYVFSETDTIRFNFKGLKKHDKLIVESEILRFDEVSNLSEKVDLNGAYSLNDTISLPEGLFVARVIDKELKTVAVLIFGVKKTTASSKKEPSPISDLLLK